MIYFYLSLWTVVSLPFIIKNLKFWLTDNQTELFDKLVLIKTSNKILFLLVMLCIILFVVCMTIILLPLEFIDLWLKRKGNRSI